MKKIIKIILGFNITSIIKLITNGPERFLAACSNSFRGGWDTETRALSKIPKKNIREILGDREPSITYSISKEEGGSLPLYQASALLAILVAEEPKEVLEIGTFLGSTTKMMAENLENSIIHTVDLPEDFSNIQGMPKDDFHLIKSRIVGKEFKGLPYSSRIKQYFGDTATLDFKTLGHPTFFFIDGSHTYEYCKNDSEKCFEIAPKGSVFLWHDCDNGHPGVVQFISEWRKLGRNIVRIDGTPIGYWKKG